MKNGESWVRLNGEIVEDKIRNLEISNLVSEISKNLFVRKKMVSIQQSYSDISNLIMDGRDIGSVVFPNADIKFWVTASAEKRAYRRWLEYKQKGKNISIQEVTKNINYRDENDQNRKVSPLIKPINSIIIDSTEMNIEETFDFALTHIQNYLKNKLERILFEIAYNGANYHGWQKQENASTVQESIEKNLSVLLKSKINIVGCGRTDTGVHAEQYFFHVDISKDQDFDSILNRLNLMLPPEILIKAYEIKNLDFHARFSATSRTYEYRISQKRTF